MIDPQLWGNMPGLGRAPLQAAPVSPSVSSPMQDIARRLIMATGNDRTRAGDMPIGALVRDPATMTQSQQIAEMQSLGGFPGQGQALGPRAPAAIAGGLASLGGVPGAGIAMGQMAKAGMRNRQRDLAGEITQGMMEAQERGSQARDQRDISRTRDAFADAYEAGRQAAVGYRNESRDQARDRSDISRSTRGSGTASFTRGDTMPF